MPLLRASGLVAGLGSSLVLTLGGAAGADSRPSAKEVAKARAQAQEQARELDRVETDLATARARQEELARNAEQLIEAYNGERVRLKAVRASYAQAVERLRSAADQVQEARAAIAAQASERYGGIGLSASAVLVAGLGDLGGFLRRASLLSHLSDEQTAGFQRLRDTQRVYEILHAQAARAYAAQLRAVEQVRQARDAAQEAVNRQIEETRRIEQEKENIAQRLDAARSRLDRLKRERREERAKQQERERSAANARKRGISPPSWTANLGSGQGERAARWALKQLGKPYVWAGAGPKGFDCSGLTMRAWQRAGVSLDHWTGTQWTAGRRVSLKKLRTGDLLFYGRVTKNPGTIHHVGIYIGRGLMVHAPRTGDVVRISPIWRPDLVGATRPSG